MTETLFNTQINVKRYRDTFQYQPSTSLLNNVNLLMVRGDPVDFRENVTVRDLSGSKVQNRINREGFYKTFSKFTTTRTSDFLVTNIWKAGVPLFYKHTLFTEGNNSLLEGSVKILDKNKKEISPAIFFVDLNRGQIYHNYKIYVDKDELDTKIYLISYSLKDSNNNTYQKLELLHSDPIFTQATVDDLNSFLLPIGGSQTYLLIEGSSSFQLKVADSTELHAIKENSERTMRIFLPQFEDPDKPWNILIENKQFSDDSNTYSIPEVNFQNFFPAPPYKHYKDSQCRILLPYILQTKRPGIVMDSTKEVLITVRNEFGELKNTLSTENILSVDKKSGLILLNTSLKSTDKITASFYIEEEYFELTDLDFNPFTNREILNQVAIIFNAPTKPDGRAIQFVLLDKSGNVVSFSDSSFSTPPDSTSANFILGEVAVGMDDVPSSLSLTDIRTEGGGLKEGIDPKGDQYWLFDQPAYPYPAQGAFYIEIPESILIDNGGKFKKEEARNLVEKHCALGIYPIIRFTGEKPIILNHEWSNGGTSLTITWTNHKPGTQYNVWYCTGQISQDSVYEKANATPIVEAEITENSYTINGLSSGSTINVYIEVINQ